MAIEARVVTDHLLRRDRWIVAAALALVFAASAAFILSGGGTGMSIFGMASRTGPAGALLSGVPDMLAPMAWSFSYAMLIFFMWWLMMVAMMVPSAAPTILLYSALHRERGVWGALEFLLGYLAAWAAFSLVVTVVQGGLAASGLVSTMYMNLATPYLGATVLIGAGLYQLTPVKAACLAHCRGPVEALTHHRRTGRAAAFRMGALHGSYCLGCCWALMALLFVGGIMNLWWILGLTAYVAIEKLVPGGERLTRPLGVALILAGIGVLFLPASSM